MAVCPVCGGQGQVPDHTKPPVKDTNVRGYLQYKPCAACGGTGKAKSEGTKSSGNSGCVVILPLLGATLTLAAIAISHIA
jgi:DnaJ-class molecular chaperone